MKRKTNLAGTTFEGRDRCIRSRHCKKGTEIFLARDMENKYDEKAIAAFIYTPSLFGLDRGLPKQIGFINASTAEWLAPMMDNGTWLTAKVVEVKDLQVTIEYTDGAEPKKTQESALINCPDCSHKVSRRADSCPSCGAPIAFKSNRDNEPITTTQETSKKLKAQSILSVIVIAFGFIMIMADASVTQEGDLPSRTPFMITSGGCLWYVITRFRIWWNHK